MTSKTKYLIKPRSYMKELFYRRQFVIVITLVSLLIIYPVWLLLMISSSSRMYNEDYMYIMRHIVFMLLRGTLPVTAAVTLAVFIAVQGFSYIFDVRKVDFYESQPVTRKKRFFKIFNNGLLIFFACFSVSIILGVLTVLFSGRMTPAVFWAIIYSFFKISLIFIAAYGLSTFSCMLTGTALYAVAMSVFMIIAGAACSETATLYMDRFFISFTDRYTSVPAPLSLLWHINRIFNFRLYYQMRTDATDPAFVLRIFSASLISFSAFVLIGGLSFAAALYFYKKRRTEYAGSTFIYYPVHIIVKFVTSVTGGLLLGIVVEESFFAGNSFLGLTLISLFAAASLCVAMEMLYKKSVKSGLLSYLHIPLTLSVTMLILLFFRLDIAGYDRFVPSADKVESCAIVPKNSMYGQSNYYDKSSDTYFDRLEFAEKYMYISDIDTFAEIVKYANEQGKKSEISLETNEKGVDCIVMYRMRNGKIKYRSICIPYDTDEALMRRIIESKEYKEGFDIIYRSELLEVFGYPDSYISFNSIAEEKEAPLDKHTLDGFIKAYKADTAQLSYDEMKNEQAVGYIRLCHRDDSDEKNLYLPVYGSFGEVISLLKYKNIYTPLEPEGVEVSKIRISVPVYSSQVFNTRQGYYYYDKSREVEISDEKQIEEVQNAIVYGDLLSEWYDRRKVDTGFEILGYEYSGVAGYTDYTYAGRLIVKDRLPEFLEKMAME